MSLPISSIPPLNLSNPSTATGSTVGFGDNNVSLGGAGNLMQTITVALIVSVAVSVLLKAIK